MNKEEIEKAKEDLTFMNEGDYITREMSNSKDVLIKYIESLELINETWQVSNEMFTERIKDLEQKESILDKVTEELKKIHEKYTKEYERVEGLELYTASIYVQQELGCVLDDIESILMMKGIDSK